MRKMDVDWSDWKGAVTAPEHPLSKPLGNLKKGKDSINLAFAEMAASILRDAPKQPTNEQLFGHLVVPKEELEKKEKEWESGHAEKLKNLSKPIDHLNKAQVDVKWGYGKSFNQLLKGKLTEEEIVKRNMDTSER